MSLHDVLSRCARMPSAGSHSSTAEAAACEFDQTPTYEKPQRSAMNRGRAALVSCAPARTDVASGELAHPRLIVPGDESLRLQLDRDLVLDPCEQKTSEL